MGRFLIDKNGDVTPAYEEGLEAKFGYPMPDFDLPSFAVRNFGAIDLEIGDATIIVRFRWLTVTPAAIDMLLQTLLRNNPGVGVTIHAEMETWIEQGFSSPEQAAAWIVANRELWVGSGSRNVITTPRSLKALSDRPLSQIDNHDDRLSLMFKKWRLVHGTFSSDMAEFLVRFSLLDRTVITFQRPEGDPAFEYVGSGVTIWEGANPEWTYTVAGRPMIDQPDPEFGKWSANIYANVMQQGQPTFDHVDAVVRHGKGTGRFRYDRLLLPWLSSSGTRLVTGLSFKTNPDAMAA